MCRGGVQGEEIYVFIVAIRRGWVEGVDPNQMTLTLMLLSPFNVKLLIIRVELSLNGDIFDHFLVFELII